MKYLSLLFLILFFNNSILAQGGYVLDPVSVTLPDTAINLDVTTLKIPTSRDDVKAIGMGKTQIANGKKFNAMLYNPALLSRSRFTIDALSLGVSLPPKTYDAANYLNDHLEEFKSAVSLREMWEGVSEFNNAQTFEQQLNAIRKIQRGLKFPKELLSNVIGSTENPTTHGVRTQPAVSVQIGNFGLSIYGVAQSAFEVVQSPVMDALLAIPIPDDFNDQTQVANAIIAIAGVLQPLSEINDYREAIPVAYSISHVDIVGAAGYAFDVTPAFNVGLNLKVIHRRFAASRILLEEYNNILNIFKRELNHYITGFTFDVGALYRFPSKTEIGLSIQNIVPVKKISSSMHADFAFSFLDYKRDQFGQIEVNNQGDTVLQSNSLTVNVGVPFDLELPMIINLGAVHPITENWDVALDWADIAEQDIRFEKYEERIRIGTEYRLDWIKDKLGVAFRVGMADTRFTGGIGFNIYKALQLDGAYAYDNYVGAYAYFAQIKLGW